MCDRYLLPAAREGLPPRRGGGAASEGGSTSDEDGLPPGGQPGRWGLPNHLVLTSSGGHCSGRYASHWNTFLLHRDFRLKRVRLQRTPDRNQITGTLHQDH